MTQYDPYSCLMSVYRSESPRFLKDSLESMASQSVPPTEYVMIIDGPISIELREVLNSFSASVGVPFHAVEFPENKGLHEALRVGVLECSNEIIARMDTDDISHELRMEKQLAFLRSHPDFDAVGCVVDEFIESCSTPVSHVSLPETHEEIVDFAKKRNPCRHPAMVMRKQAVINAGNYRNMPFFEDYDLFVRMICNGSKFWNLQETLVYMRVSQDFYARRGGKAYFGFMKAFRKQMKDSGFTNGIDYFMTVFPHAVVCLSPNAVRNLVYRKLLRS